MDVSKMIRVYIKMRDKKEEIVKRQKQELEQLNADMQQIENALMAQALQDNAEGFKTEFGTASIVESLKASCSDWAVFTEFLQDKDPLDFMERKLKNSSIKEYMEANEGILPPGVTVFREQSIRVTRPRGK